MGKLFLFDESKKNLNAVAFYFILIIKFVSLNRKRVGVGVYVKASTFNLIASMHSNCISVDWFVKLVLASNDMEPDREHYNFICIPL